MDLRTSSFGGFPVSTPGPSTVLVVQPSSSATKKRAAAFEVSRWGKTYAVLLLLETVGLIALCVLSIAYAAHSSTDDVATRHSLEFTAIVAIVASVALLYFGIDSLLLENVSQFAIAQAMHLLLLGYCIWHYCGQGDDLGRVFHAGSLYVLIAVSVFQLLYILLAYPVVNHFGWRVYRLVGSNAAIRPIYRTATIFFSLLKLDFTLGLLLVLLSIFFLLKEPAQIALNCVAIAVTFGWLLLGRLFVQRESRRLAVAFFALATLTPAFVLYKLIESWHDRNPTDPDDAYPVFSWNQLIFTGAFAIIVRALVVGYGIACVRNFGHGLLQKVWQREMHTHANPPPALAQARSPNHTQEPEGTYVYPPLTQHHAPVVVVHAQSNEAHDQSALRSYLQPLL